MRTVRTLLLETQRQNRIIREKTDHICANNATTRVQVLASSSQYKPADEFVKSTFCSLQVDFENFICLKKRLAEKNKLFAIDVLLAEKAALKEIIISLKKILNSFYVKNSEKKKLVETFIVMTEVIESKEVGIPFLGKYNISNLALDRERVVVLLEKYAGDLREIDTKLAEVGNFTISDAEKEAEMKSDYFNKLCNLDFTKISEELTTIAMKALMTEDQIADIETKNIDHCIKKIIFCLQEKLK